MTHKVLVQVWCEIDPTINVRIDRKSGDLQAEPGDRIRRVSPWGRSNVTAALTLENAEVTAFAVGTGHNDALRHALAAGATRAIELGVEEGEESTDHTGLLAEWCAGPGIDLIVGNRFIGRLAGRLGWSHLAGVGDLSIQEGRLHALRHLERGAREEVIATLPAAVCLQADVIRPPYVSRGRIGQVSTDRIERKVLDATSEAASAEIGPLQQKRARTRTGQTKRSTSSRGADRLASLMQTGGSAARPRATDKTDDVQSPEDMAEQFVRYLRHHDLLRDRD